MAELFEKGLPPWQTLFPVYEKLTWAKEEEAL